MANIRTKAVRDGDEWVINGSKMWITNAIHADWLCALVRTSDEGGYSGMSQIIVAVGNTIGKIGRGFHQQMAQFVVERM